jgi:hypothetical protein
MAGTKRYIRFESLEDVQEFYAYLLQRFGESDPRRPGHTTEDGKPDYTIDWFPWGKLAEDFQHAEEDPEASEPLPVIAYVEWDTEDWYWATVSGIGGGAEYYSADDPEDTHTWKVFRDTLLNPNEG